MVEEAVRRKGARRLAQRPFEIPCQIQHAVHDHDVERRVLHARRAQVLEAPARERKPLGPRGALRARGRGRRLRAGHASGGRVDAQHEPVRPHPIGQLARALAVAASQVQHAHAAQILGQEHLAPAAVPVARHLRVVGLRMPKLEFVHVRSFPSDRRPARTASARGDGLRPAAFCGKAVDAIPI